MARPVPEVAVANRYRPGVVDADEDGRPVTFGRLVTEVDVLNETAAPRVGHGEDDFAAVAVLTVDRASEPDVADGPVAASRDGVDVGFVGADVEQLVSRR